MRVAFLTCREFPDSTADDRKALRALERRGARVRARVWDEGEDWGGYDLVVVRSTWDYQRRPAAFLKVLEEIDASGARLVNPLEAMRWNLDKRYLRELEGRGVPVVATAWHEQLVQGDLLRLARGFGEERFVIKPVVGASAQDTYLLDAQSAALRDAEITPLFSGRPLMVQPFMERIASEGEYSVTAFAGAPSHAALKRPGEGDYRVQEEYGGGLGTVPLDAELREVSRSVIGALASPPPYARIDLVRDGEGRLRLMELELVEPDLFLRIDEDAAERFAQVLIDVADTPEET